MKTNSTPNRQNGDPCDRVNDSSCAEKQPSASTSISSMCVQWSNQSKQVTQMAGLAYFVRFLETTGLFNHFVESCPLAYQSNNAPHKRAVLGTILLSVLSGHTRYAHMNALSGNGLDAQLLKMQSIPSEDSIRSALRKLVDSPECAEQTHSWLSGCFEQFHEGVFQVPWILDVDATVKPLYGKQQVAVVGYNPTRPGRPSHVYHSFWVAHLRSCLDVQVLPGNQSAGSFSLGNLLEWLKQRASEQLPQFVRGDISYGTQRWMKELEALEIDYLFKLKQTKGVKELIAVSEQWTAHFPGWQCCESTLQLSGWDCSRRVVVYRRVHRRKVKAAKRTPELCGPIKESEQLPLEVLDEEQMPSYEYAVYVTSLSEPAQEIRALYNPRGDNENCYDELKNQWGWCVFTVRDLARNEMSPFLDASIFGEQSFGAEIYDDIEDFELKAMLELRMPLERREARGERVLAESKQQQLLLTARFAKERISTEVRNTHSALVAAHEQISMAEINVALAEELEAAEKEVFNQGASDFLAVQLREKATFEARIKLVEAVEAFFISLAAYQAAAMQL